MGSYLLGCQRERQTQRVPFAVLVEGAVLENDGDGLAVVFGDDVGVFGGVGEGGEGHCAVVFGDVVSVAAHVGGVFGAVHGAAVVVVVGEGAVVISADGAGDVVVGGGDVGIGDVAAADSAVVVGTDDATDIHEACDAGVAEVDVADFGIAACQSEEALVDVGSAAAVLADADATDGVAVAVEVSTEATVVVASYGLIVALSVVESQVVGVERDVGSELEVLAPVAVGGLAAGAVHAVGEQQQLVLVVYHVGVGAVALVHGGPVDGDDVCAHGDVGVGHGEGRAAEGAAAYGVGVMVAGLGSRAAVREGEAELVAAAVVEVVAAL